MSFQSILILLGVLVALTPFSGLPLSWLEFLLPILGLMTAVIGYVLRRQEKTVTEVEHSAASVSV